MNPNEKREYSQSDKPKSRTPVLAYIEKSVGRTLPNADLYGKALPYIPKPKIGEDGKGLAEPAKSQRLRAYPKKNEHQTTERISGPLLIAC
jgi:hypothetical protein